MSKRREHPPITLAEATTKVIITPDADPAVIAGIDSYKTSMFAEVSQSRRTFKVRVKTRNVEKERRKREHTKAASK